MHYVGLIPALLIAKGLCVGIVLTLYIKASSITWLPAALKFVALFYTVGAIIPWSLILFNELL
jgi:integral membrane sensor domain MASE1